MHSQCLNVLRTFKHCELMKLSAAVSSEIRYFKKPVITGYELGRILFSLYQAKKYKGKPLSFLRRSFPTRRNYTSLVQELVEFGVLRSGRLISHHNAFEIFSLSALPSAGEVACCVDPFAYVSHISAMDYHGLTDQFPKMLFISSPENKQWSKLALKQMEKDLGESLTSYWDTGLPRLQRMMVKKIARKPVNVHSSVHYNPGAYVSTKGQSLRVSSLGRTFLDMIRQPNLCGGIYHVLDVFSEFAKRYLKLIVDEADRHGSLIDKTRLGYVLEERLKLSEPRIENWKEKVQRGGSRKLVAENPYRPFFSETWCLSINIEESLEL